ncbi:hypothetical protein Ppb6_01929 [Photorhabdus australis subsp. thailandensis]|uniref:Uncharacterized protein n=1 Tax=Photorhabdus australis subsp. thailandensis TaxID=2805096 RepID=A0A1C0U4L3_9GAMM|nr:hypothetical protein [Photorhabdus australis]OCQ52870.1 hypothetical protein Ppb6_01929 [Photorhabdus australis subsp. thailandensis]
MCEKNDYKNQIECLATELCILKSENYWIVKKLLEQEVVLQQLKNMVDNSLESKPIEPS